MLPTALALEDLRIDLINKKLVGVGF